MLLPETLDAELLPLACFSFAHCGGTASVMKIRDHERLEKAAATCYREGIPFRVLGRMSNVLVSDEGYEGLILLNRSEDPVTVWDISGRTELTAGSGCNMAALVRCCEENDLSGLEWAAGLPGTLGGAVHGNAGAFGGDTAGCFISAEMLTDKGEKEVWKPEQMAFAYRSGCLKSGEKEAVILTCTLSASHSEEPGAVKRLGDEYRERRKNSQPHGIGSLGSVFRNPTGMSAGKLIEDAGLKGKRIGKAEISMKHANFIVTEPGVRSADYLELMLIAQRTVAEKFRVELVPEVELIGF